jgi:two-component sensor histidine kinase
MVNWNMTTSRGQTAGIQAEPLWRAVAGPLLVFAALMGVTVYAAAYQRREERRQAIESSQIVRTLLARRIERTFDDAVRSVRRLQLEWSSKGLPTKPGFVEAVTAITSLVPSYRMVSLAGADSRVIHCWAREAGDYLEPGKDLSRDPTWNDAMRQLDPEPAVAAVGAGLLPPDRLPIVVPLLHKDETPPLACIIGQICVSELLRDVLDPRLARQFNLALRDDTAQVRFAEGALPEESALSDTDDEPVRVLDAEWDLRVLPAQTWSRGTTLREPLWTLLIGSVVSVLACGTMLQAALYRRRERQRTRQHLDALESLNQTSAALTTAPAAGLSILRQLAADAQRMLRMPIVSVLLLDNDAQKIRLVHSAGVTKPFKNEYELDELPGTKMCFQTGEVLFAPDVQRDPGPFNLEKIKAYDVRAVILVPMMVHGKPLGVIGLSDTKTRQFSDVEVRMAKLWGAQAAVIVAQGRLYDQLRQHAQTNETLLRELNHRVKNNLTGILGLLEMGRPALSADAQGWLERVAARVETMARAHELFTGGLQAVGLEDLINKTLAPIRAMKPPGVSVAVEMAGLQTPIPVERAVTVAIVLNELCYNSIVHGISAGGTLLVRGRMTETGTAAIDVIDCPCNGHQGNGGHAVVTTSSTGIGLNLVRNLVGRELRGALSLAKAADGGTIATIEFPLYPLYIEGAHQ